MIDKLQAELTKLNDNLQTIEFIIGKEPFKFYFKYLTILEKARINQSATKSITTLKDDGTKDVKYEVNEDLIPIYTILEKALDKDGKRLFSNTDPNHFDLVKNLPFAVVSQVAYQMSIDIFGTMDNNNG